MANENAGHQHFDTEKTGDRDRECIVEVLAEFTFGQRESALHHFVLCRSFNPCVRSVFTKDIRSYCVPDRRGRCGRGTTEAVLPAKP